MQQELTPQQYQAIELLASGAKMGCIAETLGVGRETLWRWRQRPEFAAAQRERARLGREQMKETIAEIVRLSLLSIERELLLAENPQYRNPLDSALSVLRMLEPAEILSEPEPVELLQVNAHCAT